MDAALERWPAMKSGPSIINLDDSDNEEMDETAAKLATVAEEPRVEGMVKVEPADSLLPLYGSNVAITPHPLFGCSQVVELDSRVEVKGPVAHLKCERQAKLTNAQKQKDKLDVLIENQALLVEMIRKIQRQDEEMKKLLLDLRRENLSLSKFAPTVGHVDNFPSDQQSQLFWGSSSCASSYKLGSKATAPLPQFPAVSKAGCANPMKDLLRGSVSSSKQCREINPTTSGASKTDSSDTPPVALPLN